MIERVITMKQALFLGSVLFLSGCGVAKTTAKVATFPFKAGYEVVETTGQVAWGVTEFTAEGIYKVGKGVYYVGSVPVKITDAALDTTDRFLRITTQMVDLTGKVVTVSRDIQRVQLEKELLKYKGAKNVVSVLVDVIR